jgi:hypothetical protein
LSESMVVNMCSTPFRLVIPPCVDPLGHLGPWAWCALGGSFDRGLRTDPVTLRLGTLSHFPSTNKTRVGLVRLFFWTFYGVPSDAPFSLFFRWVQGVRETSGFDEWNGARERALDQRWRQARLPQAHSRSRGTGFSYPEIFQHSNGLSL